VVSTGCGGNKLLPDKLASAFRTLMTGTGAGLFWGNSFFG